MMVDADTRMMDLVRKSCSTSADPMPAESKLRKSSLYESYASHPFWSDACCVGSTFHFMSVSRMHEFRRSGVRNRDLVSELVVCRTSRDSFSLTAKTASGTYMLHTVEHSGAFALLVAALFCAGNDSDFLAMAEMVKDERLAVLGSPPMPPKE